MNKKYLEIISKISYLRESALKIEPTKKSLVDFCMVFCKVYEIEHPFDFENALESFFPFSIIRFGVVVADLLESDAPPEQSALNFLNIAFIQSTFFSNYISYIEDEILKNKKDK